MMETNFSSYVDDSNKLDYNPSHIPALAKFYYDEL